MSHELRTPLNSLLILAKLLGDNPEDNLSDEQVKFAQTIESSGNDLLTLINDILDLSKIEAGQIEIQPATVSLERLAGDMQKLFQPVASESGLTFEIALADTCPRTIETDRSGSSRCSRTCCRTRSSSPSAAPCGCAAKPVGEDRLELAVERHRHRHRRDQQGNIFEAFHQADGTISRKYGGTGLGLSISRELVRLLGGSIMLDSKVGRGSRFTVTIPHRSTIPRLVPARERGVPVPVKAPRRRWPRRAATAREVARPPSPWAINDDREALGAASGFS